MTSKHAPNVALIVSLLMLAGCGGLFGGGGKANLYRFGNALPPTVTDGARPETAKPLLVFFPGSHFQRASGGDRILTVTGSQVGYIADARWISPASHLFDAATVRELERLAPVIRLVGIGESPPADYVLSVDVRRFEAVYSDEAKAPPDVIVDARMTLIRKSDRTIVGEWPVMHSEPAQDNRVSAIVAAFDRGTATVTGRIAELARQKIGS